MLGLRQNDRFEQYSGKPASQYGFCGTLVAWYVLFYAPRTGGFRVRNHSGGQNVLLVFTVRVFLHDKHPRTLDPLGRSWEMTEPDKKGRSAP